MASDSSIAATAWSCSLISAASFVDTNSALRETPLVRTPSPTPRSFRQSARALASLDEREISWEGSAVVRLADGRQLEYQRVAIELANTADMHERHAIDTARAALVQRELAPLRLERFQRERDITEELGIADGYNATFELLSGIDLNGLRAECDAFLRETQSIARIGISFVLAPSGVRPCK